VERQAAAVRVHRGRRCEARPPLYADADEQVHSDRHDVARTDLNDAIPGLLRALNDDLAERTDRSLAGVRQLLSPPPLTCYVVGSWPMSALGIHEPRLQGRLSVVRVYQHSGRHIAR
jgi:hypothetical protein